MKIIKSLKSSLIAATIAVISPLASAEIAIVVNPESEMAKASASDITQLFLGKRNEIDGQAARALRQPRQAPCRAAAGGAQGGQGGAAEGRGA